MDRIDDFEMMPRGMREYLSNHGRHFSKPMYEWAVSMMEDRNKGKIKSAEKDMVIEKLKTNNITVERDKGYDIPYVWAMATADYMGSSIADEIHLAKFVKDYIDDIDGAPTRAFDEFYAKTMALGIPIVWEDVI